MKALRFDRRQLARQIALITAGLTASYGWAQESDNLSDPSGYEEVRVVGLAASQERNLEENAFNAKTMTRLDIDDLASGLSVGRSRAGNVLGEQLGVSPDLLVAINGTQNGSPQLEPWRSDN